MRHTRFLKKHLNQCSKIMWETPRCKVEVFLNLTLVLFYVQSMQTILLFSIFFCMSLVSLFLLLAKITELTKMSCKYHNHNLCGSWNKWNVFLLSVAECCLCFFFLSVCWRHNVLDYALDIKLIFLSHSLKWIKNTVMNQKRHKTCRKSTERKWWEFVLFNFTCRSSNSPIGRLHTLYELPSVVSSHHFNALF